MRQGGVTLVVKKKLVNITLQSSDQSEARTRQNSAASLNLSKKSRRDSFHLIQSVAVFHYFILLLTGRTRHQRVPSLPPSAHFVLQPSNIPVLMKYGHTIVVLTPSFPVARSSSATDSAKPTAANLLAQ